MCIPFGIFVYTPLVGKFCRDGGLNENGPQRFSYLSLHHQRMELFEKE